MTGQVIKLTNKNTKEYKFFICLCDTSHYLTNQAELEGYKEYFKTFDRNIYDISFFGYIKQFNSIEQIKDAFLNILSSNYLLNTTFSVSVYCCVQVANFNFPCKCNLSIKEVTNFTVNAGEIINNINTQQIKKNKFNNKLNYKNYEL